MEIPTKEKPRTEEIEKLPGNKIKIKVLLYREFILEKTDAVIELEAEQARERKATARKIIAQKRVNDFN